MAVEIDRTLAFAKSLVFNGQVLSKSLAFTKRVLNGQILSKSLTFTKSLVLNGRVLSKSLTLNKSLGGETPKTREPFELSRLLTLDRDWGAELPEIASVFILSRLLTLDRDWEGRVAFVLSKSLTVDGSFLNNNLKRSVAVIKHVSYPANLPLEQTSQVWIEKTDGSVDSVVPLIAFIDGEPALICDAINPKLLIGLTDDFDIVFSYKPKNILPNQKYRFVIKRV